MQTSEAHTSFQFHSMLPSIIILMASKSRDIQNHKVISYQLKKLPLNPLKYGTSFGEDLNMIAGGIKRIF